MTGSDASASQGFKLLGRRFASPVVNRLQTVVTSGLTPEKLALTLCVGTALGVMPLLWGTTLICIMLAHILRLNQVALQSINYLLYPLQLALLLPFYKMGAWLFPYGPLLPLHILATLVKNPWSSFNILGWMTIKAVAAWMIAVLPTTLLVYWILRVTAFRVRVQASLARDTCK
jgi:uncharacterized protein (DUF2062 family)